MEKKTNSLLIFIASILIIAPIYLIANIPSDLGLDRYTLLYNTLNHVPSIIGCLLLFTQYKLLDKRQKRLFKLTLFFVLAGTIGTLREMILDHFDSWKTNTMSDLGPYIIPSLLFYLGFFGQRIICFILLVDALVRVDDSVNEFEDKDNNTEDKVDDIDQNN